MNATPSNYREEVLKPFFKYIKSGESFYVVGAPSVGKTRLMDFLMGYDPDALREGITPDPDGVKQHYLGAELSAKTWLARMDMNRLKPENDRGFSFFELMLNSLLYACNRSEPTEENKKLRADLAALDSEVIESKDALKALRFLEMAVNMLCQSYDIIICFLFDEFDESYHNMSRDIFAHLRAIRDANKYRVSYALFLRNLPDRLHDPRDNEGFYELISRNTIGIGPYTPQDTYHIIGQLEKRREHELPQNVRERICSYSGGHPGLIQALFTILKENPNAMAQMKDIKRFVSQEPINEEFRKLWLGLLPEEQSGLHEFAHGNKTAMSPATGKLLTAKGLLKSTPNGIDFFSPLFGPWIP